MVSLPLLFLTTVLLIAAAYDLLFHKIPNCLTYSTMIGGVFYYTHLKGLEGLLFSVGGIGLGMAFLIIPFLMGGMGAGDVKLMGAVGGLLGPKGVFIAFLLTAVIGGIYALVLLTLHGHLKEMAKRCVTYLKTFIFTQKFTSPSSPEKGEKLKLRYGLAISLGTFISTALDIKI